MVRFLFGEEGMTNIMTITAGAVPFGLRVVLFLSLFFFGTQGKPLDDNPFPMDD